MLLHSLLNYIVTCGGHCHCWKAGPLQKGNESCKIAKQGSEGMQLLRSTLCKNHRGLKNFRLRFSFWAHMLLSWVSVIFQGTLKWKHPPLSALVWVLNVDTEISSRIHVWDKAASSDCYVKNNDNPYVYYTPRLLDVMGVIVLTSCVCLCVCVSVCPSVRLAIPAERTDILTWILAWRSSRRVSRSSS